MRNFKIGRGESKRGAQFTNQKSEKREQIKDTKKNGYSLLN